METFKQWLIANEANAQLGVRGADNWGTTEPDQTATRNSNATLGNTADHPINVFQKMVSDAAAGGKGVTPEIRDYVNNFPSYKQSFADIIIKSGIQKQQPMQKPQVQQPMQPQQGQLNPTAQAQATAAQGINKSRYPAKLQM
jgi:hypothetical protein